MTTTSLPDNRLIKPEVLKRLKNTIIECFSKGQFHEVGLREICKLAKVSPNTIYKYCGTKENLLYFCVKEDMECLTDSVIKALKNPQDLRGYIQTFSDVWFGYYQNNPAIARIVFLNIPQAYWMSSQYFLQKELVSFLQTLLLSLQKQGEITQKINVVHSLDMIIGSVNRILTRWLTVEENVNLDEMKSSFVNFVTCALSAES